MVVMQVTMDDSRLTNINQLRDVLKGSQGLDLSLRDGSIEDKYQFIDRTVKRFCYSKLRKREKRVVRAYLAKFTGYKHSQLNRLIKRARLGTLKRKQYHRANPHHIYTGQDIKLLEETDRLHRKLNGLATKEILRREVEVFGQKQYQHIARVSRSHLYNLRESPGYKNSWVNHTKPSVVPIGVTTKPDNQGLPGSIRVDTVHQRDLYHVNAVDEITQWEVVVCVPTIAEQFMLPAIIQIIDQCPFAIFNFHSDRGCENINYKVAALLNRLLIRQTKSRSRHPNDNALVETKNGSVVRKQMGWEHLDQGASDLINHFYQNWFNPYLNFHRPCLFSTATVKTKKGRQRKVYSQATTPYEKLKETINSHPKKHILKPGLSLKQLDCFAYCQSDNEFATILRKQETKLFNKINKLNRMAARVNKT